MKSYILYFSISSFSIFRTPTDYGPATFKTCELAICILRKCIYSASKSEEFTDNVAETLKEEYARAVSSTPSVGSFVAGLVLGLRRG